MSAALSVSRLEVCGRQKVPGSDRHVVVISPADQFFKSIGEVSMSQVFVSSVSFQKRNIRRFYAGQETYTVRGVCRMSCSNLSRLHEFAKSIGVNRGFFDSNLKAYIISNKKRKRALRAGARLEAAKA